MLNNLSIGKTYYDMFGPIKICAWFEKRWLIARRPHAAPHLFTLNEFAKQFSEDALKEAAG